MKNMYLHTPRKSIFKLLTLFVACTIIFSSLTALGFGVMAEEAEDTNVNVWQGDTADGFAGGHGTEDEPYLISNGDELNYLRVLIKEDTDKTGATTTGKYFKLTADIYLNDVSDENWQEKTTNHQLEFINGPKFAGHLDGDGHIVYGLYQKGKYASLIPIATRTASVKNLGIKNAFLSGKEDAKSTDTSDAVGSIVASISDSPDGDGFVMQNCFAEDVSVAADYFVGGLVGSGTKTNFENCYFKGTLTARMAGTEGATTNCGAFLGLAKNKSNSLTNITNCYSVGSDPYIIAYQSSAFTGDIGTFKNVYTNVDSKSEKSAITVLSDEKMKGSAAKTSMGAFDFEKDWIALTGTTPELRKFHNIPTTNWDGTTSKPSIGDGTATNPYQITNAKELAWMVERSINKETYLLTKTENYILANDIIVNDTSSDYWKDYATKDWYYVKENVGGFKGHFDGRGHKISGLYASSDAAAYTALFPYVLPGAVIANVGVVNSSLHNGNSGGYAAAIAGKTTCWNEGVEGGPIILVSNCYADNVELSLNNESGQIAGIVATGQYAVVRNCWSNIKAYRGDDKTSTAYGIVGYSWVTSEDSSKNQPAKPRIAIYDCYSIGYEICSLNNGKANCTVENAYTDFDTAIEGVTNLDIAYMTGSAAKDSMTGFDFNRVWSITDEGTPQLKTGHNGDIDFDGLSNGNDLQSLRNSLLGSAAIDLFQNVNRDDTIDIRDLVSLYNIQSN